EGGGDEDDHGQHADSQTDPQAGLALIRWLWAEAHLLSVRMLGISLSILSTMLGGAPRRCSVSVSRLLAVRIPRLLPIRWLSRRWWIRHVLLPPRLRAPPVARPLGRYRRLLRGAVPPETRMPAILPVSRPRS